ncbi:vitamin B12 transport ATP-binding protein BacA [Variibacter gotjawalensis]|uniref:Vitamin B12 transport ATP-binding protein BacA n=1 Tax=Variibacter gotjawalensis TaxID=1333996 RepID=A0A0S3PRW9_9BRAD|nr:ABC transporter ATP-binding protein/permease [Variibacter gotjawalensis]NIK48999.1 putative ATP-binding cassette transporter [Variibacter gotjawalensis]RZS50855.1 putative ATP-binding cassette transporter [Variibacter gotjawalensis]BAT58689.1 vitamin B12 transport ATP-binding protein BacA [Variibacter gotjawalensis]
MVTFSSLIAAFSVFLIGHSLSTQTGLPLYVGASGLILAVIVFLAMRISSFLRIFIAMYGLGFLFLATLGLAGSVGILPESIAALLPPTFMASAAVVFAAVVYGVSFLTPIRHVTAIADPYFDTKDPSTKNAEIPFTWLGRGEAQVGKRLVGLLVAINFLQVALQVRLNLFSRDLFNALGDKNAEAFWFQLLWVFVPIAAIWISLAVYELFVDQCVKLRWRRWLTERIYGRWLDGDTHYRLSFAGEATDNPDQRIQTDVSNFIIVTMRLTINLLQQAALLVSFIVILWQLSRDFVFPGLGIEIPGLLVWAVLAYAVIGTWLTHVIGKPLIGLNFSRERVEADFRFSLARLREYPEQIALLKGEAAERARLDRTFGAIIGNTLQILSRNMKLTTFTAGYGQAQVVFPYLLGAPSYFLGKITLGAFQQTAGAFSRVADALNFFIDQYRTIAEYKATLDRLTTFNGALASVEDSRHQREIELQTSASGGIEVDDLQLGIPTGRTIVSADGFRLKPGEATLIGGPSGCGKTTLFRALAGIWPFAKGTIKLPKNARVMLLPQKPYIPLGTLTGAIAYPAHDHTYTPEQIRDVLTAVGLGRLIEDIERPDNWSQRLSGGEQQRLAMARALLEKPDWLLLDEATSALDEQSQADIYRTVLAALPNTTVISIGHRASLVNFHKRHVQMQKREDGLFHPTEAAGARA